MTTDVVHQPDAERAASAGASERMAPAVDPVERTSTRQLWILGALAAGATLLILWLFSPRYAYWPALHVPEINHYPDTHRAAFTLLQLDNPFIEIDNFSNRVIEWRLLFPLVFHYLHLPAWLFLAVPWIGCLLVLWYVAWLVWHRTRQLPLTAAAIVLIGTTSWFFTSTGWLTYFDSWYVLGGLVMAFGRSWPTVLVAAALTPWIDERIVFMLPASLAARAAIHWCDTGRVLPDRKEWRLAAAAVVPLGLYAAVRVASVLWFDAGSQEYAEFVLERNYPPGPLAAGTWMGLRLAWAPVVAVPLLIRSRPLASVVGAVAAVSLAFAIVIAGDVSRSMSMLIPVAVAGVIMIAVFRPDASRILILLAAGNLLLPASHVVTTFTVPIFSARYELHRLESPPPQVDSGWYLENGVRFAQAGDSAQAIRHLDIGRRLARHDEELAISLVQLADREIAAGRPQAARIFYRQALEAGLPAWVDEASVRARLEALSSDTALPEG